MHHGKVSKKLFLNLPLASFDHGSLSWNAELGSNTLIETERLGYFKPCNAHLCFRINKDFEFFLWKRLFGKRKRDIPVENWMKILERGKKCKTWKLAQILVTLLIDHWRINYEHEKFLDLDWLAVQFQGDTVQKKGNNEL